jgi:hypothetical protein
MVGATLPLFPLFLHDYRFSSEKKLYINMIIFIWMQVFNANLVYASNFKNEDGSENFNFVIGDLPVVRPQEKPIALQLELMEDKIIMSTDAVPVKNFNFIITNHW